MRIFLIAGKARSGKQEVATFIKQYFDKNNEKSVITEYSKYIKLFATEMIDWNGNSKTKPRKFLQDMGAYIRNDLNMPNFFTDRMHQDIKVYEKYFSNIIIADVRLVEEIEEMKVKYPFVYSIYVINKHGENDLTETERNHPTEHALDNYGKFDKVIVNENLKDLKKDIFKLMEEVK